MNAICSVLPVARSCRVTAACLVAFALSTVPIFGSESIKHIDDDDSARASFTITDETAELDMPRTAEPRLAEDTRQRLFVWRHCDHARAGMPWETRCLSIPSRTQRYAGYRVGGSAPLGGAGPTPLEGTWGWDYRGFVPKLIALDWHHSGRRQGGLGAYQMDGPRLR